LRAAFSQLSATTEQKWESLIGSPKRLGCQSATQPEDRLKLFAFQLLEALTEEDTAGSITGCAQGQFGALSPRAAIEISVGAKRVTVGLTVRQIRNRLHPAGAIILNHALDFRLMSREGVGLAVRVLLVTTANRLTDLLLTLGEYVVTGIHCGVRVET